MMQGIHWSAVCRDDIILVEAGEDPFNGQVTQVAQELLKKKPTAGFEYCNPYRCRPLRGIKFHVYEKQEGEAKGSMLIWTFACVYNSNVVQKDQVQSFLEKICGLTMIPREEEHCWRHGGTLAAHETYAPILLQRMEEVMYRGRAAMVHEQVDLVREQMGRNIDLIMARGEKLEDLQEEATRLEEMSRSFQKGARKLKRAQMWQNAKYGVVVGTAVTTGVAIIVIPPLVALL